MDNARDLTLRLQHLLGRERAAMAEFLLALADFDRRRLWLDLGYASLFDYLRRELGLSKSSAFFRMKAAGLLQRFPEIVEPLGDGRLCLSSVAELAKVLTEENKTEVLPRFFLLSKREAKAVSAALRPDEAPTRRDVVTTVRVPVAAPPLAVAVPAAPVDERDAGSLVSPGVVSPEEPYSQSAYPTAEAFLLRPRGGGRSRAFRLGRGDLLVTGGTTQRTWQHSVPKVARAGPRISVAFRYGLHPRAYGPPEEPSPA